MSAGGGTYVIRARRGRRRRAVCRLAHRASRRCRRSDAEISWPVLPHRRRRRAGGFLQPRFPVLGRSRREVLTGMSKDVDLYDTHYGHLAATVQTDVRRETYDEDLGQSSWITLSEAREWFRLLRLDADSRVLEVGCGTGGMTRRLAAETGASVVGVDINAHGIEAATSAALRDGLSSRVTFQRVDAGTRDRK